MFNHRRLSFALLLNRRILCTRTGMNANIYIEMFLKIAKFIFSISSISIIDLFPHFFPSSLISWDGPSRLQHGFTSLGLLNSIKSQVSIFLSYFGWNLLQRCLCCNQCFFFVRKALAMDLKLLKNTGEVGNDFIRREANSSDNSIRPSWQLAHQALVL